MRFLGYSLVLALGMGLFGVAHGKIYDVIVLGATPAGIAAAVGAVEAASRHIGAISVAILAPESFLGGAVSGAGVGLAQSSNFSLISGIPRQWADLNGVRMGEEGKALWQPPATVGEASFFAILSQYPSISLHLSEPLQYLGMSESSGRIQFIATGNTGEGIWHARVFVDATYEGDLVQRAGVPVLVGREGVERFGESLAGARVVRDLGVSGVEGGGGGKVLPLVTEGPPIPVGDKDLEGAQGLGVCVCVTTNTSNSVPFSAFKPASYDPNQFTIVTRYLNSLSPLPTPSTFLALTPYASDPTRFTPCTSSSSSSSTSQSFSLAGINEFSAAYLTANSTSRVSILSQVQTNAQGLLYFLATDPSIPSSFQSSLNATLGVCADQWRSNGHFPPQLLVRDGYRMDNGKVWTQKDLSPPKCSSDSIAVSSWHIDLHTVHRELGNHTNNAVEEGAASSPLQPTDIPLSVLLPPAPNATNLLSPTAPAASHVAASVLKVEPTAMLLGQAAGATAVQVLIQGAKGGNDPNVQDIKPADVQALLHEMNVTTSICQ